MSMSQRSFAASAQRRPYDSTPFLSHARSAIQAPTWRNPKSEGQWRASLRDHAGALMPKPVDAIGPADVLAVLGPVWNAKRETARRVRQRISKVMDWARAEGHRADNPVDAIGAALPKNGHGRKHHKALPYAAVSGALATVRESGAWWADQGRFRVPDVDGGAQRRGTRDAI